MRAYRTTICVVLMTLSYGVAGKKRIPTLSSEDAFMRKYDAPSYMYDRLKGYTGFFEKINQDCINAPAGRRHYKDHLVWRFDTLPGYLVKRCASRLHGRQILLECIQKHNLDLLGVPQKYLYHVPGTHTTLSDDSYWVICEEIVPSADIKLISLQEMQQICTLIEQTGYEDFQPANIIRTQDDRLIFIDTEIESFDYARRPHVGLERIITRHKWFEFRKTFTDEALMYLLMRISQGRKLPKKKSAKMIKMLKKQPTNGWDYVHCFKKMLHENQKVFY